MNALSLHQPWASAMALGLKTVETRSWPPPKAKIGEGFVIASTKQKPPPIFSFPPYTAVTGEPIAEGHAAAMMGPGNALVPLPLGCIVASGVLLGAVATHRATLTHAPGAWAFLSRSENTRIIVGHDEQTWGDFSPGRWAWLFSDLARVEDRCPWCWGPARPPNCPACKGRGSCAPIPVKGHQRVWQWEPEKVDSP